MKLKRKSLLVLIIGVIILFAGAMMPLVYWNNHPSHNGAIGLIGVGAADAPSYMFALSALYNALPVVLIWLGISLVISSGFCLLFSKTVKTHCSIKSSAIMLGMSGAGVLGLICVFSWFTIVSFGEISTHPIEYSVSIILGILCFLAFVLLIALYCKSRKTNRSMKGVIIDILTGIVYLPAFYCIFGYLYEMFA